MRQVTVALPSDGVDRSYEVVVGHGARARVGEIVGSIGGVRRAAVVTQEGIPLSVGDLGLDGVSVSRHVIGDGEDHKSLDTVVVFAIFEAVEPVKCLCVCVCARAHARALLVCVLARKHSQWKLDYT